MPAGPQPGRRWQHHAERQARRVARPRRSGGRKSVQGARCFGAVFQSSLCLFACWVVCEHMQVDLDFGTRDKDRVIN